MKIAIIMTSDQIKIVASGNDLIIKNQWDGVESTCSPESELFEI